MLESLPPRIGGRYRPIRLLGRGGMGIVYEVEHVHTSEILALKVLSDRALASDGSIERFRREARVPARIRSEHVVRVVDADAAPELGGAPYLVMELLHGEDLRRAAGEAPQPPDRVIDWLAQVARALDKAHGLGIIHRDLKPENLFLARRDDGTSIVKILDFGIAKMTFDGGPSTASDQLLGTPLFMAPEQAELKGAPATSRTDLFALGLIAYKLLTGRHYWVSDSLVSLVREICLEPMPPPSKRGIALGPAFDAWFARACHRDPAMRFETATAQIHALAEALASSTGDRSLTVSATSVSSPASAGSRRPLLTTGLALAAVLAGGAVTLGAMFAARSRGTPGPAAPPPGAPASVASEPPDPSPVPLPSAVLSFTSPAASLPPPAPSVAPSPPQGSAGPLKARPAPVRSAHPADPFADQH
jgi:serine/threonine-protein kinase